MTRTLIGSVSAVAVAATMAVAPAAARADAIAPTQITKFKITTSADARMKVSGTLTATGATVPAGEALTIETAPDDKPTAWVELPVLDGQVPLKTQDGGAFSGEYYAGYPHGYYRVRYAGSTSLAATVSNVVRDKRTNTLVFSWKVSPRKIKKNAYVTFTGVLKRKPGKTWKAYPGQRVYIMGRIKGETDWYWYARPKTNSKGAFKARFRVGKDTYFEYYYEGNKTHYWDFPLKSTLVDVR